MWDYHKYLSRYSLNLQQCKNRKVQLKSILKSETPFHVSQIMEKQIKNKKNSNLRREKFDCHLHHEGHHLLIHRPSPTKTTTQPCFDAALQVLSSKNVWFIFNFNFLYVVWLDLISGFDCLVDEKKNS